MSHRRHLAVLAAVAAAVPALAAPGAAEAAGTSCYKSLPGPGAGGWKIQQDGSQDISHQFEGGSNFDADHGALAVNDDPYPMIPDAENACFTTDTSVLFPQREVGGLLVRRRVNSVSGRIRRIDTLTNTTDAFKLVKVELAVRVLGSQVAIESESGDAAVTTADSWSVHQNDGGSNPFLQWGEDGFGAIVISHGDEPNTWQQKAGAMPDATLQYFDLPVPPHETVRLLHMNGTTGTAAASETAAKDTLTPFSGVSQHDASQVINWGDDPDGDGVGKAQDECPGVKGNQPDGCFTLEAKPADQKPAPPADPPPADAPPAPAPAPAPPPAPPAADTRAPSITIAKLRRSVRRTRLTRKGVAPRIACDEACSITVKVNALRRGRSKPTTVLTTDPTPLSTATRKVRLKLKPRHLRRLAWRRVTVVVTATDAAGNRRSVTRIVRLGR